MTIAYHHEENLHSLVGAKAGMKHLLAEAGVRSVLDVGCGTGTWLRAAQEAGVTEVMGVDGVAVDASVLHVREADRQVADLTKPWRCDRRFDLAICLEVAEHLPLSSAPVLIDTLVAHADLICFSAACPDQPGENHINCQWPAWWQRLFNERGFACDDSLRWRWWNDEQIEPWYRQNAFLARRSPHAGEEARIPNVVHPAMLDHLIAGRQNAIFEDHRTQIENGALPLKWSLMLPLRAVLAKGRRYFTSHH